jgi:hypothetical protein
VTITYSDGTVLKAIVLSHEEDEIRAIAAGCDDVLAFTRIHDTWISEEIEPVSIEFEWQRQGAVKVLDEVDCICSKKLASRLISMLLAEEGGQPALRMLFTFSLLKGAACESNHSSVNEWMTIA